MAVYAPLRLAAGTGYQLVVTPATLIRNSAYYAAGALVPLPDDYRYLSDLSAWMSAPWFALIALASIVPAVFWLAKRRPRASCRSATRWLAWSVLLILPALPILAERESYLPSAGVALAIGAFVARPTGARQLGPSGRRLRIGLGSVALAALLAANWVSMAERVVWWNEASRISSRVVESVLAISAEDPPGTAVAAYNVPDRVHFAHVQGRHLDWTLQLMSGGRVSRERSHVRVWPDDGLFGETEAKADAVAWQRQAIASAPVRVVVLRGDQVGATSLLPPAGR